MSNEELETLFDEQMKRLRMATGTRTQVELANMLGICQGSVSEAKRRRVIPVRWLDTLRRSKSINPDWILDGEGLMYLPASPSYQSYPHVVRVVEVKPPEECSTLDLVRELVKRALRDENVDGMP